MVGRGGVACTALIVGWGWVGRRAGAGVGGGVLGWGSERGRGQEWTDPLVIVTGVTRSLVLLLGCTCVGAYCPWFSRSLASPTQLSSSDEFANNRALSAVAPRVAATITKRCMSSCAKFSNFAIHFASIIDPFVSYSC